MNIDELKKIVSEEKLDTPVLYNEGIRQTDSVVLEKDGEEFKVFLVGERNDALPSTQKTFSSESEALEHVLLKLRQSKKARWSLDSLLANAPKPTESRPKIRYIEQLNGANRSELVDRDQSYAEQIRQTLNNLDGTSQWAYTLWRAPAGNDFSKEIPFTEEYMQCVGSADALSVEVRTLDSENEKVAYSFTIGKPGDYSGNPTERVSFYNGKLSKDVYENELFTADEAATLFYTYLETNGVTRFYNLRNLSVTKDVGLKPPVSYYGLNDTITDQTLNEAIVLYVGKGVSSYPKRNDEAVRDLALKHNTNPKTLQVMLYAIYSKCMGVAVEWDKQSLSEASHEARGKMAELYPNLDEAALDALQWAFSYNNK